MASGTARYAREGGTWFLQLGGDLRHPLGPALNALLDRAFADPGFEQMVVDLSDAENIDSTCLGILARIGKQARQSGRAQPTIISNNDDISELLLAVCFDRLFTLVNARGLVGERMQPVPAPQTDTAAALELVLAAHRRLCEIDARNHSAFQEVVTALEDELQHKRSD